MKKIISLLLIFAFLCGASACSTGISKEEYNIVLEELDDTVAENEKLSNQLDEYKSEISELEKYKPSYALENSKIVFADVFPGLVFSEIQTDSQKILLMTSFVSFSQVADDSFSEYAYDLGNKASSAIQSDWFDYDYIYIDVFVKGIGMLTSMTLDCSTMSIQYVTWEFPE